jgi:ArsR family transcriptional regulator
MDDLARKFKALSDANRLAIFERIRAGFECCTIRADGALEETGNTVSEIAAEFDLSLSTVSHHLKELRTAGLVLCRRRGRRVFCLPDEKALQRVGDYLLQGSNADGHQD